MESGERIGRRPPCGGARGPAALSRTLVAGLVLGLTGGCVETVALHYPPHTGALPFEHFDARWDPEQRRGGGRLGDRPAPVAPRALPTLAFGTFEDLRPWHRVGDVRNGLGMHTARVETPSDVRAWIVKGLRQELALAGLGVALSDTVDHAFVLDVRLHEAFAERRFHQEGRVDLTVFLRRAGDRAIVFVERFDHEVSLVRDTDDGHAEALSLALQDVARDVARGVRAVLHAN